MSQELRPAVTLFLVLTLITGLAYPFLTWGIGQALFARQANGGLIERDGRIVGSRLIGQPFAGAKYFWSRPSATTPMADNAQSSSGSNLGPSNPALLDAVRGRIAALKAADPANTKPVPVDLVTASASGLDPHISPAAAYYQIERVAGARNLSVARLRTIVDRHVEGRQWGVFGERRVNVLELNLDLDAMR